MPNVELPGVNLWYEDTGSTGTAVIFLHAASGTADSWEYQLPAFTATGYRCVAYDRRAGAALDRRPPGCSQVMAATTFMGWWTTCAWTGSIW